MVWWFCNLRQNLLVGKKSPVIKEQWEEEASYWFCHLFYFMFSMIWWLEIDCTGDEAMINKLSIIIFLSQTTNTMAKIRVSFSTKSCSLVQWISVSSPHSLFFFWTVLLWLLLIEITTTAGAGKTIFFTSFGAKQQIKNHHFFYCLFWKWGSLFSNNR